MKKNRILIAGVITAFVALITLSLVSGTWAKYTSSVEGSDTAKVAKWEFTYGGKNIKDVTAADIKLFDETKIYDLDDTGNVSTTLEEDVKTGTGTAIIAPGVGGVYKVSVVNNSEVNATYEVAYELQEGSANVPLEFSTDNETWGDLASVATAATEIGQGATKEITVYWRWAFNVDDATDVADTKLGEASGNVTIKVVITFTQVD